MQTIFKHSWTKHIDFLLIDVFILVMSFWVSYSAVFENPFFWHHTDWVRYLIYVVFLNIVLSYILRPYSGILRRPYYMEAVSQFKFTVVNVLIATFVLYLLKVGALYSRGTSFYMYIAYFVFSSLANAVWKKLLLSGKVVVRTTESMSLFIIGDAQGINTTIHSVTAGDYMPYDVKGIHLVDHSDNLPKTFRRSGEIPYIGEDYLRFILDNNIQEVLVAVSPSLVEDGVLEQLHANAININIVVESIMGFQPEDQYFNNVGLYKAFAVGSFSFESGQIIYLAFKRIVDILCGLLGLVLLLPVTLFVKLAYLASGDKEKVFYRQARIGQNGKIIRIWKFRSMVPNADEVLQELLKDEKYRKEWDESQKFEDDPRITKVGRVLRKTSIDELPQFINVLVGDMSLVGPRPLVEGELEKFGGLKLYQRVKPGITGWWACNGRSNIDYRERLELEYYYVKNCSLYLDLLCVMRTVLAVIKKDGAK